MCLKSPRASSSSPVTDDEQNAIYRFEEMPCSSPSIICKMADVVSVDGMGGGADKRFRRTLASP